jgi:ATP synthase protein I
MTTAPQPPGAGHRPSAGAGAARAALVRGLVSTLAAGLVLLVLAAALSGGPGATGVGIGLAMVCVFFGSGALVLGLVAAVSPGASLLVALLTYTLQVVLAGLVLAALGGSGELGRSVDAGWLAATLIGGTLIWLGTQIFVHVRSREPLYDLPPSGTQAGAR